jgi:hypothetical protein
MTTSSPISRGPGAVSEALHTLVSQIPTSPEPPSETPHQRARALAQAAAFKAAALSGSFTLPPGPLGLITVLPDLLAVWRVQQQLVADIAATFGKTTALTSEAMVIALFRHGGAALTRPLFARQGHEVVLQRITQRTLWQLLEKIGVRVAQRLAAKSFLRWLPILGAVGAGAYAYYDTTHVAANAIELFSRELRVETEEAEIRATPSPRKKRAGRTTGKAAAKSRSAMRKRAVRSRRGAKQA